VPRSESADGEGEREEEGAFDEIYMNDVVVRCVLRRVTTRALFIRGEGGRGIFLLIGIFCLGFYYSLGFRVSF
jgi:hypothetical protein